VFSLRASSYIRTAQIAEQLGVTEDTHGQQNRYWGWFLDYLCSIELDDNPFLDGLDEWTQGRIVGAYVAAYRTLRFRPTHYANRAEPMASTCTAAISAVDQAFRSNRRRPPGRDETGKLHFFLSRQLRGYANLDPATKGQ
jgi:hypothetical protein